MTMIQKISVSSLDKTFVLKVTVWHLNVPGKYLFHIAFLQQKYHLMNFKRLSLGAEQSLVKVLHES